MEEYSQHNAGHHEVQNAELRRDVQTAELVVLLIIRGHQRTENTVQRQHHRAEAHDLHEVVEPVARLVEGQVALVAQDGQQSDDEHQCIQLQCLNRDALCGFRCPHAKVQHAKSEASHERSIGL